MSVFDAKDFMVTELGMDPSVAAEVAGRFSADHVQKLGGAVKRQSDYSRSMDQGRAELERERAALADKEAQLVAEATEWANLTASEKRGAQELRQRLEATEQEALALRQTVTRMAESAGVDPTTLLPKAPVPPPAAPSAPPAVDTSKFVSTERVDLLARMSLHLPAQIADLKDEHLALTGKPLNTTALVAEMEKRALTKGNTKPVDLRAIWEEQHNIPQVRADQEAARVKALEDAAFARGREAALTEGHLPPGAQPSGRHAVVFNSGRTSVLQRPQPGTGLQSAINALATGKYRGEGAKTT